MLFRSEPYITLTRIYSEDWNDVQLQNSWYNFETGFSNVQFRKENNRVYLRGLLHTPKSGPIQETTIFTLPSGYRPKYSKIFSVRGEALDPTNNKTAFVFRLDIRPSGIVIFEPFNARVDGSNGGYISLEGISFEIDLMLGGMPCRIDPTTFQNDMTTFKTRDDVLTLLIHLGYLAYDKDREETAIPNQEIAQEYLRAMKTGGGMA